jgi:branched-chain amino acid aminotransferase
MAEEQPRLLWFNGSVVAWEDAKIHVWSELAVRGASVFDGIRTFWHHSDGRRYVLSLEEHLQRLFFSAKILKFPCQWTADELRQAIFTLLKELDLQEHAFIRPTLFIETGRYGFRREDTVTGAYIVAFPLPRARGVFEGVRCCVSSWRRASDLSVPPRVKAGAFYQGYRLSRIEAVERGMDDTIFLNDRGTVAESSGSSIFVVRDGDVFTPPVTADILESVTRKKVIELFSAELGIVVREREINRTELYIADEIFLGGTITEIQPVIEVDGYVIADGRPGPITTRCRDRYIEICESGSAAPQGWLTPAS